MTEKLSKLYQNPKQLLSPIMHCWLPLEILELTVSKEKYYKTGQNKCFFFIFGIDDSLNGLFMMRKRYIQQMVTSSSEWKISINSCILQVLLCLHILYSEFHLNQLWTKHVEVWLWTVGTIHQTCSACLHNMHAYLPYELCISFTVFQKPSLLCVKSSAGGS